MKMISRAKRLLACLAAVVTVLTVMSGSSRPVISESLVSADTDDVIAELDEKAKETKEE